jgi:hypothetical protein
MVTMDSDYLIMASKGISHAGLVFVNGNASIGSLINALVLLHAVLTPAEIENQVEYV